MSEDTREAILNRLVEVGKDLAGIKTAKRNELDIQESDRPAFVVLDADESTDDSSFNRGRPARAPVIVGMTPECYLLIEEVDGANIGTTINDYRRRLIKAVLTDASLVALCKDGDIRFEGFATGLASGRSMEGEAGISFSFHYVLRPDKL